MVELVAAGSVISGATLSSLWLDVKMSKHLGLAAMLSHWRGKGGGHHNRQTNAVWKDQYLETKAAKVRFSENKGIGYITRQVTKHSFSSE